MVKFFESMFTYFIPRRKYAKNDISRLEGFHFFISNFFKKRKFREPDNELYFFNKRARLALFKAKRTGMKYYLLTYIDRYKKLTNIDLYNMMYSDRGKTFYQVLYEYYLVVDLYRTLKMEYEEETYTFIEMAHELGLEKEYIEYAKLHKGASYA